MANRRMFSKTITNSSAFLRLPATTQILYIHLGMNADDFGYCEHFTIMGLARAKPADLKQLEDKGYIEVFNDDVLHITEWNVNNQIRKERITDSKYTDLYPPSPRCHPDVTQESDKRGTQGSIGKVSIGKDREEKKQAKKKETISLPDWLDKEAWEAWVTYRKEIRKKLTPSTIKKQIAFLEKDKERHKGIMDRSIMNGWTGLHPLDNQPEYSKPTRTRSPEVEAALANQFKMEE